jgi:hypothetical protein
MNPGNTRHLFDTYPKLYAGHKKPITENLMPFGFECGDGWFKLIDRLSSVLEPLDVEAVQVKEKFGGLRFYIRGGQDDVYNYIEVAEEESLKTCETCGRPGEPRSGGWIKTLCDACWVEKS